MHEHVFDPVLTVACSCGLRPSGVSGPGQAHQVIDEHIGRAAQ